MQLKFSELYNLGNASTHAGNRQPLAEGWMIHFMLDQPDRRLRHYWVLSGDSINMYNEYNDGWLICELITWLI